MNPLEAVQFINTAASRAAQRWRVNHPPRAACRCDDTSVHIEGLNVHYGAKPALQDVTLHADSCSITAIIGPSGCGKSSLLACLNRLTDLIPGCCVSGNVRIGTADVFAKGQDLIALRQRVGMIFQRPNPFPLSILRNIQLPLHEQGIHNRSDVEEIATRVLRDVGLFDEVKDRLNTPALALSGGQQQRLCIARALALDPEVILFDEPCSALDPISSGVVEDLIASLRGKYTVLIVTHNLAQARRIADSAAMFWVENGSGTLIEHRPCAELFAAPAHEITAAYVSGIRG